VGGLMLLAAAGWSCGNGRTSAEPSPAVIATASAYARQVTIASVYRGTPTADSGTEEAVSLDGRVFGTGPTGVVLAHMRPADQTSWFAFALRLAETGEYTVLTFNFRGYEASTGEKDFNRVGTDLAAAYDYMRRELGLDRIFLVGASMGGTAALLVSASREVAGVVSISSFAQYQELDALASVSQITAPKLFVTSADDIPAQRSQADLWVAASEPKEQEIYPGDAHGTDIFASPNGPRLEERIMEFLASR
jgi:pimeloyl-ACP methyl ester carboxylesterase